MLGAIPVSNAPTTPPMANTLPRLACPAFPAACERPHTAPPINKLASEPAKPAQDSQLRICCQNAAPGKPSIEGDEATCAVTPTIKLIMCVPFVVRTPLGAPTPPAFDNN